MDFVDTDISAYAEQHSERCSSLVEELHDWTVENSDFSRMLSGPLQVSFLRFLARSVGAERVLEIGMYTGYSALAIAEVLPANGRLVTLDIEPERQKIARSFFDRSEAGARIDIHIGPALEVIPTLGGTFDMVYIDADKANYIYYYEMTLPLLTAGGVIVADNVLWSGEVLAPDSEDAHALVAFNQAVQNDPRVINTLLPIRDGLMVIYKKP